MIRGAPPDRDENRETRILLRGLRPRAAQPLPGRRPHGHGEEGQGAGQGGRVRTPQTQILLSLCLVLDRITTNIMLIMAQATFVPP